MQADINIEQHIYKLEETENYDVATGKMPQPL